MKLLPRADRQGFALVFVLGITAILALIAAAILRSGGTAPLLARNALVQAQNQALAEAGINRVIFDLLQPPDVRQISVTGKPFDYQFAGQTVTLWVQDQSGKIDLNATTDQVLKLALGHAGLSATQVDALADAIADWGDADDQPRLNGVEAEAYRAVGKTYGPRNGPFESVAELRQVLGMDRKLFDALAPLLTVYSARAIVDMAVASDEVLGAMNAAASAGRGASGGADQSTALHAYGIDAQLAGSEGKRGAVIRILDGTGKLYWLQK